MNQGRLRMNRPVLPGGVAPTGGRGGIWGGGADYQMP